MARGLGGVFRGGASMTASQFQAMPSDEWRACYGELMRRVTLHLVVCSILVAGCRSMKTDVTLSGVGSMPAVVTEGAQGVVVPPELGSHHPRLSARWDGFWLVSPGDVRSAERAIAEYLAEAETNRTVGGYSQSRIREIRQNLPLYRRHYVGVTVNTERRVFCNVLPPNRRKFRDWRTRYIDLIEGAPNCWRVECVKDRGRCTNFNASFGY